jgi:DNA-binding MarR family transcriptional regulator
MDDLVNSTQLSPALPQTCGKVEPRLPNSALRNAPLHRLFKAVEQAFRQQFLLRMRQENMDVFPGAAPLILHLGDEDNLTMSELGKRCGLESSTMTPLVDELERRRLISRVRAPEDRRVIRVHLTPAGRDLEPRLRKLLLDLQAVALCDIPDGDIAAMHRVLESILANLGAHPD